MKTVTVTVREALLIRKLLTAMNDTKMPLKTAEKLVTFTDELATIYVDYTTRLNDLANEVGEHDADGNLVLDSKKNPLIMDKRKVEYQRRKKAIEQSEVKLNACLEMGDVAELNVTPAEYKLLRKVMT
ncbi:MAG: hypothetical protein LUD72_13885 [Bacteroidales bacterium]|nr:hypothetical protein [Bacteroidales bacterium]